MTIRDLVVFKALRVHQLRVEPKRVKAVYSLCHFDGRQVQNELIYSYDSPYFNPREGVDINLASMMAAQLAINYGLFCERIVFDGLFDAVDQRFISDMMENTAREILVNKFFAKNEFLKPSFCNIQPEKSDKYSAAELEFANSDFADFKLKREDTVPFQDAYVILSSGGKDSLLTYGLVRELGVAHPVFINESGRHWFTAVNAFKYFRENEPNTAKPWCNSDRIFNWMLRQMPFIKENFQNIRADIYPVRLWTVAVFLFGVLPIARKRNAGNILIGNEFDTTLKGNYEGISHYNGLYDQSKYFDNALSRYYRKKGWNISQYSILRSLSELLILKVLVKRYPDLQRTQVSCHAAHEEEGRMLPCGKCEKCRRIVGMLRALKEDPKRCGYTDEQINKALHALGERSVKQIGSDAAHLYYMLMEADALARNEHTKKLAKSHPRIMDLRFDNERSKMEDIPVHIRKKLIAVLMQYADGISLQKNKIWHRVNPEQLEYDLPYIPFKKTTI